MSPARFSVYLLMGPIILASWLTLAFLDPDPPGRNVYRLGYFLGSLFAHPTLAAAWMALGPGRLIWRAPLSIAWVLSLPIAIGINVSLHGGPPGAAVDVGGCLLLQWLLLQLPLWSLAIALRLQLRHRQHKAAADDEPIRFGIRHLLIVMTIVGVLLGIGRLVVPLIDLSGGGEVPIFIFLAVAAVILMLPLLLSTLMRRMALPGVLLSLLLVGIATAWELPLMSNLGGRGPDVEDFIAINVTSASLTLLCAFVVRLSGYRLESRPRPALEAA